MQEATGQSLIPNSESIYCRASEITLIHRATQQHGLYMIMVSAMLHGINITQTQSPVTQI